MQEVATKLWSKPTNPPVCSSSHPPACLPVPLLPPRSLPAPYPECEAHTVLPACLCPSPFTRPACLPACLPACMPSTPLPSLPACPPPSCPPACPPPHLSAAFMSPRWPSCRGLKDPLSTTRLPSDLKSLLLLLSPCSPPSLLPEPLPAGAHSQATGRREDKRRTCHRKMNTFCKRGIC